ncbi:MAG: hypothetical protein ABUL43_03315 [Hyphomicrobium sp.]
MKTTPYFLIAAIASFIFTYCVFAAASDDQGVEHWMAQQTSSIAAMSGGNGRILPAQQHHLSSRASQSARPGT